MSAPLLLPQGVHCRNLTKDYGSGGSLVRALRGVNLDIPPGELTLLVGPSGCGKTTLISILAATLDATGGDVSVLGADLARLSRRDKAAAVNHQPAGCPVDGRETLAVGIKGNLVHRGIGLQFWDDLFGHLRQGDLHWVSPGNLLFETAPIPLRAWLVVLPFALLMLGLEETRKWLVRRKAASRENGGRQARTGGPER